MGDQAAPKFTGAKQKNMSSALEQLVQESGKRADPIFSRGAEIEVTTMQDVEMLKAHLASVKIHIPTKAITNGIIMPRDFDSGGDYPAVLDYLTINPHPRVREGKKKKGAKAKKGLKRAQTKAVGDD